MRKKLFARLAAGALVAVPLLIASGHSDATEPPGGGTLRFGYETQLASLDPYASTIAQDLTWQAPVYDRLVHVSPDGELIPGLAESWEFSDDHLTLTLHLREGVTFHDGAAFNADAVLTNFARAEGMTGAEVAHLAVIDEAVAVDEFTVELSLSRPAASLLGALSDRAGAMVSPEAIESGVDLATHPVGAGMFRFDSYQEGDRAVYTAFEDYWDPAAVNIERLEIVEITEANTRLNALLDGQLDAARIDADGLQSVEDAGLNIEQRATFEIWWLQLNHEIGELSNPLVRQAINYAIDRQAIVDALWGGAGTPVSQMFPPGYAASDPESESAYAFDPERAQELMTEAGSEGFDLRVAVPSIGGYEPFITAIQQQLAAIGVNLQLEVLPVPDAVQRWLDGDALIFGSWTGRPDPYLTLQNAYSKDSGYGNAPAGTENPEIEELLGLIESSTGDERTDHLQEANRVATEFAFHVPVLAPDFILAAHENVSGLAIYITAKPEFRGVSVADS